MDLRARLRQLSQAQTKEALRPVQERSEALRNTRSELVDGLAGLDRRLEALEQQVRMRSAPFSSQMTVHQAWARHPGVAAIFARHHLPDCPACPVGLDERLEEAAFGYGIDLQGWLDELNALLDETRR